MPGKATIRKQPGGSYKALDRMCRYERTYKHKSGDQLLGELTRLLKKQGLKHRIIESDYEYRVLWI
jgi:hypothetical protein